MCFVPYVRLAQRGCPAAHAVDLRLQALLRCSGVGGGNLYQGNGESANAAVPS